MSFTGHRIERTGSSSLIESGILTFFDNGEVAESDSLILRITLFDFFYKSC